MTMRIVQHKRVYVTLICSVLSTVNGQCSGNVQTLSVGYSAISFHHQDILMVMLRKYFINRSHIEMSDRLDIIYDF